MAVTQTKTYTVQQVADMVGMARQALMQLIKKNKFPFPVIQMGTTWMVPRKAVDKFMQDDRFDFIDYVKGQGRPRKWVKGQYTTWNYKIPIDLAEAFKAVVGELNSSLPAPISYNDARLLALQEFVERRPIEGD
jgi:excisionase family DNA binding protein